ncbi:hypothetical protein V8C34DRAFT_165625 [Trichoderma compactum]
MPETVLVIGGTGAQGVPVVKALASDGKYAVRVLTRTASSQEAKELAAIPGVTIFEGDGYYEPTLLKAFEGVSYLFANTNGFAIGEKAEIYWGTRLYELSRQFGLKHFVYAGLEYASRLGNFKAKYRTGHLDGKGKVVDYIAAQPTKPMAWSVLTSCLYIEGLSELLRPFPNPSDPETMVFALPIGNAKMPLIYLEDYGSYARWLFDHPERSNGLELHVGTEDVAWKDVAAAFTKVTGKKAIYKDVTLDEYFSLGIFPEPDAIVGRAAGGGNDSTLFTFRQNFSGFWNTWKDELTKRDYALLDDILPTRVRSVKEWMVKVGYTGEPSSVLKDYRDQGFFANNKQ